MVPFAGERTRSQKFCLPCKIRRKINRVYSIPSSLFVHDNERLYAIITVWLLCCDIRPAICRNDSINWSAPSKNGLTYFWFPLDNWVHSAILQSRAAFTPVLEGLCSPATCKLHCCHIKSLKSPRLWFSIFHVVNISKGRLYTCSFSLFNIQ